MVTAPAKVNLFLHITGRRDNGYHELESLFAFTNRGDELDFSPSEAITLEISGPFASDLADDSNENLVLQAARALQQHAGIASGVRIHLKKNLPVAAGIGGGSADAAATLKGLAILWDLEISELELANLALPLGADIPACLSRFPKMVRGIGEQISRATIPFDAHIMLVNPRVPAATHTVFHAWSVLGSQFDLELESDDMPSADFMARHTVNRLQDAASTIVPEIGQCLTLLSGLPGASLVRMSGSGATCFGLFETAAEASAAADQVREAQPGWWVHVDELVRPKQAGYIP